MKSNILKIKKKKQKNIDLITTLAHELKTPVSSIKEAISLLSDINNNTFDVKTKRIISIAQEEINRLVRMIDNFLKVASIEAGKIELHLGPTNVEEIIDKVIESQSLKIQSKKMHIKKIFIPNPPIVSADKDRIFETIANLVDNALKFTPDQGTITIQTKLLPAYSSDIHEHNLTPRSTYLKITVSNTGPGIEKKDSERIFEKFERLRAPSKIRGIGLGLTIAKTIIELHHGRIWVTSKKGKGANFHFVLPVKR